MLTLLIGYAAALTSTIALLPQIIKTYHCRSSKELSWGMLLSCLLTSVLWLVYGYLTSSAPVVLANGAGGFFAFWLLWLKWRFSC